MENIKLHFICPQMLSNENPIILSIVLVHLYFCFRRQSHSHCRPHQKLNEDQALIQKQTLNKRESHLERPKTYLRIRCRSAVTHMYLKTEADVKTERKVVYHTDRMIQQ